MQDGERQVAPTLDGIRADHLARYRWAAKKLDPESRVVDLACGIGYGSNIMATAGHSVLAVDRDVEALDYGRKHYSHDNVAWDARSASSAIGLGSLDAAVCFETIEHIEDPLPLLRSLHAAAPVLLASVPNETVFPYGRGIKFHFRHYTPDEFQDLLNAAGWEVIEWWGQEGPESEVERNVEGRTLIAVCERYDIMKGPVKAPLPFKPVNFSARADAFVGSLKSFADESNKAAARAILDAAGPPDRIAGFDTSGIGHVVIIGLGPSAEQYMDLVKRLGGRKAFADQVWTINALGDVLACDLVFHMDDVRVQAMRADALPDSNIAQMVKWLKTSTTPIMTSRAHPDYPALVEFPLEDVINSLGYAYFNGTAAYAVAYAIFKGASKISFFGADFSYANAHHAEQGRACVEFWIGFAAARGIQLGMADKTSLLDTCDAPANPGEIGVYGYDMDHVMIDASTGAAKVTFKPKAERPTAADIERRYDHSRHPSPLLRGDK